MSTKATLSADALDLARVRKDLFVVDGKPLVFGIERGHDKAEARQLVEAGGGVLVSSNQEFDIRLAPEDKWFPSTRPLYQLAFLRDSCLHNKLADLERYVVKAPETPKKRSRLEYTVEEDDKLTEWRCMNLHLPDTSQKLWMAIEKNDKYNPNGRSVDTIRRRFRDHVLKSDNYIRALKKAKQAALMAKPGAKDAEALGLAGVVEKVTREDGDDDDEEEKEDEVEEDPSQSKIRVSPRKKRVLPTTTTTTTTAVAAAAATSNPTVAAKVKAVKAVKRERETQDDEETQGEVSAAKKPRHDRKGKGPAKEKEKKKEADKRMEEEEGAGMDSDAEGMDAVLQLIEDETRGLESLNVNLGALVFYLLNRASGRVDIVQRVLRGQEASLQQPLWTQEEDDVLSSADADRIANLVTRRSKGSSMDAAYEAVTARLQYLTEAE